MDIAEQVYESLIGELVEQARLPWVENAYREGGLCDRLYKQQWDARERLLNRLGVWEDPDVECVLDSLLQIQKELCLKMFAYGILAASLADPREKTE